MNSNGEVKIFFLACIDPQGTVVGDPVTGFKYQSRVMIAKSHGFSYTAASIPLSSIEYLNAGGVLCTEDTHTEIDLLDVHSTFPLMGGAYTQPFFRS